MHKADAAPNLRGIKKGVLLLIAQHLDRRLAQDADVQSGALRAGIGKDDLMRKGRLAAAGSSGQEVEGILGNAAAKYVIKTGNARGNSADGDFVTHDFLLTGLWPRCSARRPLKLEQLSGRR